MAQRVNFESEMVMLVVNARKRGQRGLGGRKYCARLVQHTTQPLLRFFSFGAGARTDRMASSNTFFKPFCVNAEHSRYLKASKISFHSPHSRAQARMPHLTAEISLASAAACWYAIGLIRLSRNFSIVSRSSRKSSLVPTRIMGMFGA